MLVVDNIVFSMDVWDWYHIRKNNLTFENNTKIKAFRPFMKKKYNSGDLYIDTYGELTGWDFHEFLHEIFMLFSDIHSVPVEQHITTDEMFIELTSIENLIIFWAMTEGHEMKDFGNGMRNELLNKNTMSFNRKFHVESCYKMKAIWQEYKGIVKLLDGKETKSLEEVDIFLLDDRKTDKDMDSFMKIIIKQSCGQDFDEFIIAVMERIKFMTMKENHEKLAMIKGYEIFGIEDFETKLAYTEIWRRLFPTYFDEIEDVFGLFYEKFMGQCVMYLYHDYLGCSNESIRYIPIYKLYGDEKLSSVSTNIRYYINTDIINKRIFKLYKDRINDDP